MKGIGTDIVQIDRIKKVYSKQGVRFVNRILTEKEQAVFDSRGQAIAFLANRYAAKEALAKSLGTGIADGVTFLDFEVLPNQHGKPIVSVCGRAEELLEAKGVTRVEISISDEQDYAVAFVVLD